MKLLLDNYSPRAAPGTDAPAYLLPSIIGGVGDLFNAIVNDQDRVAPYGTLARLSAILLDSYAVDEAMVAKLVSLRTYDDVDAALQLLLGRAAGVYNSDEAQLPLRAAGLWVALALHAEVVTGQTWEYILDMEGGE